MFASSTIDIPANGDVPGHIAVIMDGNGRWAKQRLLPRVAGHRRGLETVRRVTRWCVETGVEYLTLFAFSSENWRRPPEEVSFLLQLFMRALESEVARLHENNIRLKVIGDLASFDPKLVSMVREAEQRTAANTRLTLTIAANYGGRWDMMQAVNRMLREHPDRSGGFNEAHLAPYLALAFAPEPDLFIRTGGEQRISNFCLWQLAYTELWFTDVLWPDFDRQAFDQALASYRRRERRFGRTSEQLTPGQRAHDAGASASAAPADPA
jgi:undecaprenyl diphosphate synthase